MGPHSSRASLANHVVSSLRELEEIHHRFEQFTNDLKSKRLAEDEILNTHAQNIGASVEVKKLNKPNLNSGKLIS